MPSLFGAFLSGGCYSLIKPVDTETTVAHYYAKDRDLGEGARACLEQLWDLHGDAEGAHHLSDAVRFIGAGSATVGGAVGTALATTDEGGKGSAIAAAVTAGLGGVAAALSDVNKPEERTKTYTAAYAHWARADRIVSQHHQLEPGSQPFLEAKKELHYCKNGSPNDSGP
jgi:hypothetical protein